MKRRRLFFLCAALIWVISASGCSSDSKEVDDQVYALAVGIDKGTVNKLHLTVQFPTYKESGGGGGMSKKGGGGEGGGDEESGKVDSTIVESVEAPSILGGINILDSATTRRISLVQAKVIVFSEAFAREGLSAYIEPIARFRESRRSMQVVVCRGAAEDYIKENKTMIGDSLSKAMELSLMQSGTTGYFPNVSFVEFYKDILSPYKQAYAAYAGVNDFKKIQSGGGAVDGKIKTELEVQPGEIPRKGDLKREMAGTAVFDGDQMVGSLNPEETRYLLMLTNKFEQGSITIQDSNSPENVIPFDVRLGRWTKINAFFEKGKPVMTAKLNIEADLGAIQSRIPYEKLSMIAELNDQLEKNIEQGVRKLIDRSQHELNSDIFGFGHKMARHFYTIQDFTTYNWLKHFHEAEVRVNVHANVRRTGLMSSTSPIMSSGQK